jgi:hypothetical protein
MKYLLFLYFSISIIACSTSQYNYLKVPIAEHTRLSGTEFYKAVVSGNWKQRDSLAVQEILAGNIPDFLKKMVAIHTSITDSNGNTHHAIFYVCPDYLSIGTNNDFARIPLTPMAAQKIADSFHCFLPTRKMVDLIYQQAKIKLEPVPMYAFRDSSITMWQHQLIIEGQRKGRAGLIAGIKKDVVISAKLFTEKPNHVAIYGWHKLNGLPIQPLYTGHINWWVDYSHGIRLIYRKLKVDGKMMDYEAVLKDPVYQRLICDEAACNFFKYAY